VSEQQQNMKMTTAEHITTNSYQHSQAPVAHACNPSYSGGRDQEDLGSKPAQENSSRAETLARGKKKKKRQQKKGSRRRECG
jgi:hypothetical protein